MKLEEGDMVLCTVKKIEKTNVFVDIEGNGEGSIVISEISPGRIRNIRDFVVPNKKIVCKILKISGDRIELSLRRVTAKEKQEVLEKNKKEKTLRAILKTSLGEKYLSVFSKIKEEYEIPDFFQEVKENPKIIEEFIPKNKTEELRKILVEKQEKEKYVKAIIKTTSSSSSGLKDIKSALETNKAEIRYLGSSKFSVSVKAKDFKTANKMLKEILEEIKENSKKNHLKTEIIKS